MINVIKVMTEQVVYEMLLRVLISSGIYVHTLAEAESRIMSVCVCVCALSDNSSSEGNECVIIHSYKNVMRHR